jgi:DNA-binding XRE family transcriptional regulator
MYCANATTMRTTKSRLKSPVSTALRELRQRVGFSQGTLARELKVALQTCVLWETKRPPSGIMLVRLSELAEYYGHADLQKVFEQALKKLPPVVLADIEAERSRWKEINAYLDSIQDSSTLDPVEISQHCDDIRQLLEQIRAWNWRNQR